MNLVKPEWVLGELLGMRLHYGAARARLEAGYRAGDPQCAIRLGTLGVSLGDLGSAEHWYETARQCDDPATSAIALTRLIREVLLPGGRAAEALQLLRDTPEADYGDDDVFYNLLATEGVVLLHLENAMRPRPS